MLLARWTLRVAWRIDLEFSGFFSLSSPAESAFKASIALLAEFPATAVIDGKTRPSDAIAREHAAHLLSALLVVPDNPDAGALMLVRGLFNSLVRREWDASQDHQALALCDVINVLCAAAQEKYLYHVDRG